MFQTKWDKRAVTKTEQGCMWLQQWRSSWLCSSLNKHIGEAGAWNRSQWYFGKLRGDRMYGLSGTMRMLPRLKNIFRHSLAPKLGKFPRLRICYSMGLYTKILRQCFLCYYSAVLLKNVTKHKMWPVYLTPKSFRVVTKSDSPIKSQIMSRFKSQRNYLICLN